MFLDSIALRIQRFDDLHLVLRIDPPEWPVDYRRLSYAESHWGFS